MGRILDKTQVQKCLTLSKAFTLGQINALSTAVVRDISILASAMNVSDDNIDFTGATSISGGTSGLVPAPQIGDEDNFLRGDGTWANVPVVLPTVPATVDGGFWLDVNGGVPVPKFFYGGAIYTFGGSSSTVTPGGSIDTDTPDTPETFNAYLPFATSTTNDTCGNTWTTSGSPTIDDGALYLDGSSYLQSEDTETMLGDGAFTVDLWARPTASSGGTLFHCYNKKIATSGNATHSWICLDLYDNYFRFDLAYDSRTSSQRYTLNDKTWHHIAMTYNGEGEYKVYLDGVCVLTTAITFESEPGGVTRIGANGGGRNHYTGYIANYRIHAGAMLWTEDFTPPTAPVPPSTPAVLKAYLPLDTSTTNDTCGNTWTASGNPTIVDGALYLDGSSYLQSEDTETMLSDKAFTVDLWAKPTSSSVGVFFHCTEENTGAGRNNWICIDIYNNRLRFDMSSKPESDVLSGLFDGNWHHIAMTYNHVYGEGEYKAYLDGVCVLTMTNDFQSEPGGATRIGTNSSGSNRYTGYIKNYRIHAGAPLWTENFTPPTTYD